MTRLHRHGELVEAMARAICRPRYNPDIYISPPEDPRLYWELFKNDATAALDALLEAAVRLGVGEFRHRPHPSDNQLVLRMEASDDNFARVNG